jgi:hypothetical protein
VTRFIDDRIEVELEGTIRQPRAIVWRGARIKVADILHVWSDWGFSVAATQRNWRTRRHRNYYRIRTEDGRLFEIYLDRGTKPGREAWFLFQELDSNPGGEALES